MNRLPSLTDVINLFPAKPRTLIGWLVGSCFPLLAIVESGGHLTVPNVLFAFMGGYAGHSLVRADSSREPKETDDDTAADSKTKA